MNPGFKVGSSMKWVQHVGSIIVASLIQWVMVSDAKKAHIIRAFEVIFDFECPCFMDLIYRFLVWFTTNVSTGKEK